eukprot:scaffold176098_cov23-Prasinocladus_malaysianus.AAC.1
MISGATSMFKCIDDVGTTEVIDAVYTCSRAGHLCRPGCKPGVTDVIDAVCTCSQAGKQNKRGMLATIIILVKGIAEIEKAHETSSRGVKCSSKKQLIRE